MATPLRPPAAAAALAELVRLAIGLPEDPDARRVTPGAAARSALEVDAAQAAVSARIAEIAQRRDGPAHGGISTEMPSRAGQRRVRTTRPG